MFLLAEYQEKQSCCILVEAKYLIHFIKARRTWDVQNLEISITLIQNKCKCIFEYIFQYACPHIISSKHV